MKIKNKTELRKRIKAGIGTTGALNMIEFYHDGSWTIMSQTSYTTCHVVREHLTSLAYSDLVESFDKAITLNFARIERLLTDDNPCT